MSTIVRSWARTKLLIVAHERTVEFAQIVKPSGLSQPRYPCVVSGAILNAKKNLEMADIPSEYADRLTIVELTAILKCIWQYLCEFLYKKKCI